MKLKIENNHVIVPNYGKIELEPHEYVVEYWENGIVQDIVSKERLEYFYETDQTRTIKIGQYKYLVFYRKPKKKKKPYV